MYQLSRLLHDYHRELYSHLEQYEIGPSLYAAPWFLTAFASHFPLGFVARVFGKCTHPQAHFNSQTCSQYTSNKNKFQRLPITTMLLTIIHLTHNAGTVPLLEGIIVEAHEWRTTYNPSVLVPCLTTKPQQPQIKSFFYWTKKFQTSPRLERSESWSDASVVDSDSCHSLNFLRSVYEDGLHFWHSFVWKGYCRATYITAHSLSFVVTVYGQVHTYLHVHRHTLSAERY